MPKETQKAVVLLSGGIDSSVLLYHIKTIIRDTYALTVNYGQRHVKEINAAKSIAESAQVPWELVYINNLSVSRILDSSALTDPSKEIPEGHYTDKSMAATVVPNRNMILLSLAGAYALNIGAELLAYAPHAGDHPIYADCRPAFIKDMASAFSGLGIQLWTPFKAMEKADIVKLGWKSKVPFELTWSCYKGGEKHCGKCGTCVERKEAFKLQNLDDPTEYEAEP